jgi:hypothetical protein
MSRNSVDYEEDFHAWTVERSRLLRSGELSSIDAVNIARNRKHRAQRSARAKEPVLMMHLLNWQHQPAARSRIWSATIDEQRLQIEGVLAESPSLRPVIAAMLSEAYAISRARAIVKTGLAEEAFPEICPFAQDQVLSRAFLPER